jgi:hypothetical protein
MSRNTKSTKVDYCRAALCPIQFSGGRLRNRIRGIYPMWIKSRQSLLEIQRELHRFEM